MLEYLYETVIGEDGDLGALEQMVTEMTGTLESQPGGEAHSCELPEGFVNPVIAAEGAVHRFVQKSEKRITNVCKNNDGKHFAGHAIDVGCRPE